MWANIGGQVSAVQKLIIRIQLKSRNKNKKIQKKSTLTYLGRERFRFYEHPRSKEHRGNVQSNTERIAVRLPNRWRGHKRNDGTQTSFSQLLLMRLLAIKLDDEKKQTTLMYRHTLTTSMNAQFTLRSNMMRVRVRDPRPFSRLQGAPVLRTAREQALDGRRVSAVHQPVRRRCRGALAVGHRRKNPIRNRRHVARAVFMFVRLDAVLRDRRSSYSNLEFRNCYSEVVTAPTTQCTRQDERTSDDWRVSGWRRALSAQRLKTVIAFSVVSRSAGPNSGRTDDVFGCGFVRSGCDLRGATYA